jgi:hypothetical protein
MRSPRTPRSQRNTPQCGGTGHPSSASPIPYRSNRSGPISLGKSPTPLRPPAKGRALTFSARRYRSINGWKEWTDEEWMREKWRTRTARGLQPHITRPRQTVRTRTDLTAAAKHHVVTDRYINRTEPSGELSGRTPPNRHAVESTRRRIEPSGELSGRTPPNRHAAESTRRRTEPSSELSGRTPGTPPNRVDAQAVAEPNRQASCQAGRRACR